MGRKLVEHLELTTVCHVVTAAEKAVFLGKVKFGPTGSYMGNYEIKKVERITKLSSGSGGQVNTRYQKSTIVKPFF
ncbi:hypothetical protein [Peribacillus sp. NPDC096540]|uniref:hypothetical protein n=1 Tax=Peribacillus sp. NPDC096540 TaxID=3390612 RepID=UPI003CFF6B0F